MESQLMCCIRCWEVAVNYRVVRCICGDLEVIGNGKYPLTAKIDALGFLIDQGMSEEQAIEYVETGQDLTKLVEGKDDDL